MHDNMTDPRQVELDKFFKISKVCMAQGIDKVAMFSGFIDSFWHDFQETTEFEKFCLDSVVTQVAHEKWQGSGRIDWVHLYEEKYGELPEVWFKDKNGTFDQGVYDHYKKTGEIIAAWDCRPAIKPDEDGDKITPPKPTKP